MKKLLSEIRSENTFEFENVTENSIPEEIRRKDLKLPGDARMPREMGS